MGTALYALFCLGCASFQRQLIYFPTHLTPEQMAEAAKAAGLERWRNAAGQAIGLKRLSVQQPAAGQVLITYGNGSWAVGSAHYVNDIQSVAAYDVFILEYPGYADRAGSPSQKTIFQAADEASARRRRRDGTLPCLSRSARPDPPALSGTLNLRCSRRCRRARCRV
jgi:hypothetical protein